MPWTDGPGWLVKQETVRARSLVSVVLDDQRFAREPRDYERSKRRPGNVHHIGFSDEAPELRKAWQAHDAKRMHTVIVVPGRSLRGQRNFKLRGAVRITEFREASRKRKHDGLNAADTGREKMRINEQLHS